MFSLIIFSSFAFGLLCILISVIFGVFFFWRAAKHELWETQDIFDLSVVFLSGALVGGRILDFFLRSNFYEFSLRKLIFFNAYPGFDFYGAFFGGLGAVLIYSYLTKKGFWNHFDFLVFGLSFSVFIFNFMLFIFNYFVVRNSSTALVNAYFAVVYFLLFWVLKRLEKKRRHIGFFSCFFLFLFSIVNMASILFRDVESIYGLFILIAFISTLVATIVFWYRLSKRKLKTDIKSLLSFLALSVMKSVRVVTNIREADGFAKSVIFSPLYLFNAMFSLVKYLSREFYSSVVDLMTAFGVKK